jgi:hypothetical protein
LRECGLLLVVLAACAPPTVAPEAVVIDGTCTGLGMSVDEANNSGMWFTERVDAAGRSLRSEGWYDRARTSMIYGITSTYDEGGLVLQTLEDWNGDGRDETRASWERGAAGEVLVHRYELDEGEGFFSAGHTTYLYEGGLLAATERDNLSDGTVDSSERYLYEEGRPVLLEESDAAGVVTAITTWTYPLPAPTLDHLEAQDRGADGVVEGTYERHHDASGNVASLEAIGADGSYSVTTTTWEEDRPLVTVMEAADRRSVKQWSYDARALVVELLYERDDGPDGVVDYAARQIWEWSCP